SSYCPPEATMDAAAAGDVEGAGAPGNVWEGNPEFKCETCEGYASSPFAECCDSCILEDLETEEAAAKKKQAEDSDADAE
ncbi:MAG: hypothetical protein QMB49_04875, partial [Collinsella sp.]